MTDSDGSTSDQLDEWMIVELMGRVRRAGRVREVEIAGEGFLRLDIPADGGTRATQFVSPKAVYALTPTTEAIARAVAIHEQPEPAQRWELQPRPAAPPTAREVLDGEWPS
ncbi:hypothetical protein [Parafrankia discariae]|uniref:hypothetical protein n=1 Tax=Parafrankia discariae TaxID=365528 RepID=UPI0003622A16|nr:hypothetical protein [Parafrankia discariae]